nr:hypothetical protein [Tanacetum cinerariifolium]
MWSPTTATRGDIMLGSAEIQEIKTTSIRKAQEGTEEGPNYALMAFSFSSSNSEATVVRKNDDALIIEEWVLDNKEADVSQPKIEKKIVRPSIAKIEFVKPKQQEKTARKTVNQVEQHRQNTYSPRDCLQLPSKTVSKSKDGKPIWNNAHRVVDQIGYLNYKPIVAGTQSNGFAVDPPVSQDPKSSNDDGSKPSSDEDKSLTINTVATDGVNTVSENISSKLQFEPNMPALEDVRTFDLSRDDEDDDVVADMNNLDTTIQVNSISSIRIHKDHPLDQVIGDLQSATQTRKMSKNLEEHGNKKNERGIVIRNKARLVAQGYTQEKEIDYDKVFALIVRIEGIRLFLAYASFIDFMMYQMNVKSDFLYGKIKEEVYVCQPPGFEDLDFPDRVYKELCNAFEKLMHEKFKMSSMGELTFFLGLQVKQKKDGKFISQDKYVAEILKKFGFTEVNTTSAPMETQKPRLKDEDGEDVDVHMYRKPKRNDTQVPQPSDHTKFLADEAVHNELGDSLVRSATTASSLEVEQDSGNIIKTQSKATPNEPSSQGTDSRGGLRVESSRDEESLGQDASEQGKRIDAIDVDKDITLVNDDDNEMFDVDDLGGEEVFVARQNENVVEEVVDAAQVEDDKEKAELKQLMETIPDEEEVTIDAIPLVVKSPRIVDWKIHKEGNKSYYKIVRANGKSQMYMIFSQMLKSFNREDLEDLYKLVKARYGSTRPVGNMDYLLWSDMKTTFEPHVEDEI